MRFGISATEADHVLPAWEVDLLLAATRGGEHPHDDESDELDEPPTVPTRTGRRPSAFTTPPKLR